MQFNAICRTPHFYSVGVLTFFRGYSEYVINLTDWVGWQMVKPKKKKGKVRGVNIKNDNYIEKGKAGRKKSSDDDDDEKVHSIFIQFSW